MSILTFDWSQITWIGSPLMVPWWAEVQIFAGFFLVYWILCPILYYTNVSFTTSHRNHVLTPLYSLGTCHTSR